MSEEKLLHVQCLVKPNNLYELLLTLETCKVGNVEVRPVAQDSISRRVKELNVPKETPPSSKEILRRKHYSGRNALAEPQVSSVMKSGVEYRPVDLATLSGVKRQTVQTVLNRMVSNGTVAKIAYGVYALQKERQ